MSSRHATAGVEGWLVGDGDPFVSPDRLTRR